MRRLVRLAVASAAVTLTLAFVFGAAALVVAQSPSGMPEPSACNRPVLASPAAAPASVVKVVARTEGQRVSVQFHPQAFDNVDAHLPLL